MVLCKHSHDAKALSNSAQENSLVAGTIDQILNSIVLASACLQYSDVFIRSQNAPADLRHPGDFGDSRKESGYENRAHPYVPEHHSRVVAVGPERPPCAGDYVRES